LNYSNNAKYILIIPEFKAFTIEGGLVDLSGGSNNTFIMVNGTDALLRVSYTEFHFVDSISYTFLVVGGWFIMEYVSIKDVSSGWVTSFIYARGISSPVYLEISSCLFKNNTYLSTTNRSAFVYVNNLPLYFDLVFNMSSSFFTNNTFNLSSSGLGGWCFFSSSKDTSGFFFFYYFLFYWVFFCCCLFLCLLFLMFLFYLLFSILCI
jgi:hypothetical protein